MGSGNLECLTSNDLWADTQTVKFGISLVILLAINVLVIAGNTLVIVTVRKCKKLRSVTNLFIVSLAFADLFLGIFILPFSTMLEVLQVWVFGSTWCTMWLAIDVWLSTASILNLMAISLDRYIAVMRPIRYPSLMSRKRAKILIAGVWVLAFIVCLPPLIKWSGTEKVAEVSVNGSMEFITSYDVQNNSQQIAILSELFEYEGSGSDGGDDDGLQHMSTNCTDLSYLTCELTSSMGYRIYASIGSFYLPTCLMAFFYLRIYKTAVETAAALRKGTLTTKTDGENLSNNMSITLRVHRGRGYSSTPSWKDKRRKDTNKEIRLKDDNCVDAKKHKKNTSQTVPHRKNKTKKKHSGDKSNSKGYVHTFKKFQSPKLQSTCPVSINVSTPVSQVRKNPSADTASISSGSDIIEMNQAAYELNDESNHTDDKQKLGLIVPDEQARRRSAAFNFKDVRKNAKTHRSKFKRETKAAKTLAIIVGAFILCWLPFFTMYLIEAFCINCIPPLMFSVFIWLGYCNSALNPCIYALFSRDFRFAFKMLLTCRKYNFHSSKENTGHVLRNMQVQSTLRESDSLSEF